MRIGYMVERVAGADVAAMEAVTDLCHVETDLDNRPHLSRLLAYGPALAAKGGVVVIFTVTDFGHAHAAKRVVEQLEALDIEINHIARPRPRKARYFKPSPEVVGQLREVWHGPKTMAAALEAAAVIAGQPLTRAQLRHHCGERGSPK